MGRRSTGKNRTGPQPVELRGHPGGAVWTKGHKDRELGVRGGSLELFFEDQGREAEAELLPGGLPGVDAAWQVAQLSKLHSRAGTTGPL